MSPEQLKHARDLVARAGGFDPTSRHLAMALEAIASWKEKYATLESKLRCAACEAPNASVHYCHHCADAFDTTQDELRDDAKGARRAAIAECVALIEGYHEHALPGLARGTLGSLLKDLEKMR